MNKTAKTSILIIVGDPYGMRAKSPNKAVIRGDLSFFKSASSVTNQSYNKKGADATAWIKKKGYPAPAGFGSTGKESMRTVPVDSFILPFSLQFAANSGMMFVCTVSVYNLKGGFFRDNNENFQKWQ